MYHCVKRNKRLWIDSDEAEGIYTPPNFMRLQSREPMHELARQLTVAGGYSIQAIVDFETIHRRVKEPK
jgi:hypothetical protein